MIALKENKPDTADESLDLSGLHCPLPILKTKAKLSEMKEGEILHVLTTDPLAPLDFKAFALRATHHLIFMIENDSSSEFYFEKSSI